MTQHTTREEWLNDAANRLRPMFEKHAAPLPKKLRITMSLVKGKKAIGVCYSPACSDDQTTEILIRLDRYEPVDVLAILAHELVHAAVGVACGHKGRFATVARAIGLEGKLTSTVAGADFRSAVSPIVAKLGKFPHAPLRWDGERSGPKKQGTRMLKCECADCGYVCRTTAKWIDAAGAPLCPCSRQPMKVEGEEESEED